jgi:hypothetical protein
MDKKLFSLVCAILCSFIWGTGFIAQDMGMDYIGPLTFSAGRLFLGFLTLLPIFLIFELKKRFGETSNIYDGSKFTADMAIHNVIGDSFRGATWVSIHNGGGVGWGEVMNGGFGMLLDGSTEASERLKSMLFYDVNNGVARRSWARNEEAIFAIQREMDRTPQLKVTLPNLVDDALLKNLF